MTDQQQQPIHKTYNPFELGYLWDFMDDDQLEPISQEDARTLHKEIKGSMYRSPKQRKAGSSSTDG